MGLFLFCQNFLPNFPYWGLIFSHFIPLFYLRYNKTFQVCSKTQVLTGAFSYPYVIYFWWRLKSQPWLRFLKATAWMKEDFPSGSLRIKRGIQSPVTSIWQFLTGLLQIECEGGRKPDLQLIQKQCLIPVVFHKQGGWQFSFQLCLNFMHFTFLILDSLHFLSSPVSFSVGGSQLACSALLPSWSFCPFCTVSIFTIISKPLCDPCAYFCSAAWSLLFSFQSPASLWCFVSLK